MAETAEVTDMMQGPVKGGPEEDSLPVAVPSGGDLDNEPPTTAQQVKSRLEQESIEFVLLKPICIQILQNPSKKNLSKFEEALNTMEKCGTELPEHLVEYVIFPFAIHLKIIKKYKEKQRTGIFKTLAKLLKYAELCTSSSNDMFVNIFQKLHVALTLPNNFSAVNTQLCEEEMEAIVECIEKLTVVSLTYHIDELCLPDKVQIFAHSIFILLRLLGPDICKSVRLRTLQILASIIEMCDGRENRSKVLFKFLPGIVTNLRKICLPSSGHSTKSIIMKSIRLLGSTIRICTEFEDPVALEEADGMLCQVLDLLSKEFVLNSDADHRKSFFDCCVEIASRNKQLPKCFKVVSIIFMRMKGDDESDISKGCEETLGTQGVVQDLNFDDLVNLIHSASSSLRSGNDTACILTMREAASILSMKRLSFIEFQTILNPIFQLVGGIVWKSKKRVTLSEVRSADSIYEISATLCRNVVVAADVNEVIFEFTTLLAEVLNTPNKHENPTGIILTFNMILTALTSTESKVDTIIPSEAINLSEIYMALLDQQSTEIALVSIAAEIPAVQSAAELRRTYLIEGLGILGTLHPSSVLPLVLYPLLENAGSSDSEAVRESAEFTLNELAKPNSLEIFLKGKLSFILDEISVRMLNLTLYPNCPNAMIFLAQYFNFSEESFAAIIDQVFGRCADEFGGGQIQYIYVRIFYALVKSISKHTTQGPSDKNALNGTKESENRTLLQKLVSYQKSVGVVHPSVQVDFGTDMCDEEKENVDESNETPTDAGTNEEEGEQLDPTQQLVLKISHRTLNFLSNSDRSVRLTAMDCLILGVTFLQNQENAILPLSHTIWEFLIPRFGEKDYVVVRKSFELLQALCTCCGTFLKKRTIEEVFPKLSTILISLAKEGEQIKDKNRQYYTCTQAYKLQLTVLQGMGVLLDAIDVQELELDKIVSGCIMYLNPGQHKNLKKAAEKLLDEISHGKRCRTVWMKLIASGFIKPPGVAPDPTFVPVPAV